MHKFKIKYVRCIKSYSINIKFSHPEPYNIGNILLHSRITLVKLCQKIISTPVIVGKSIIILIITVEVYIAVPVLILGILAVFLNILKCKKTSSRMIKYSIKYNPYIFFMTFFHEFPKVFIVTKSCVQSFIISCLIAVTL